MTIYSLYIKIHRKTGLRYFGYTKKDPKIYQGSGVEWQKHISEYGYDVETTILFQSSNKTECNSWGRYYSRYYSVVTAVDDYGSKIWANMIPETGGGSGEHNRGRQRTPEQRARIIENTPRRYKEAHHAYDDKIYTWTNKDTGEIFRLTRYEFIRKFNASAGNVCEHLLGNRKWVNKWIAQEAAPYVGDKIPDTKGAKSPRYDHTIYTFIHDTGITEQCTRHELLLKYHLHSGLLCDLVHGKVKFTKGWKLIHDK